ncbi:Hypothetical protein P9303_28601 [Prochlorococcus marinus str. MIT 9303]|uniref:Uncharacterized protein n=2 Tax=Prochlorococcus marinus TaxID=1219 RepID=A2CDN0_PROM3|nr:Hypothetical protein P9303_28601 [Prochlorococcus marinus str. MIT 9303]
MKRTTALHSALIAILATSGFSMPVQAGLLSPLFWLGRPRLERRLTEKCVELTTGGNASLREAMKPACKQFAKPVAKCLIKQTEVSGRAFGVIVEILRGEFGDDSEVVIKLCSASIFNLPANTFMDVPLIDILDYWKRNSKRINLKGIKVLKLDKFLGSSEHSN